MVSNELRRSLAGSCLWGLTAASAGHQRTCRFWCLIVGFHLFLVRCSKRKLSQTETSRWFSGNLRSLEKTVSPDRWLLLMKSVTKTVLHQRKRLCFYTATKTFPKVQFLLWRQPYCDSLHYGVSRSSVLRLQLVQNAAARLLTGTRRCEHITQFYIHFIGCPCILGSF